MQERVNFMDKKEKEGGEPDIFCWIAVFNLAPEAIDNSSSLSSFKLITQCDKNVESRV